jgi:RNA 3'-terminal phosphate cyclase (ATP)
MNSTNRTLHIDGSQGEGGGQVLRTGLALSMLSGRPLVIDKIRAGRAKPGLMRQHLTCVRAAERICSATVDGAEVGSTRLAFTPGPINAGHYRFAIGTAGSTLLVLQTVLPALLAADGPSTLEIEGGTHNPLAPSADFVASVFLPQLRAIGAEVEFELVRHGFFPVGGGKVRLTVRPATLRPLRLTERGADLGIEAIGMVANLPAKIVERELGEVRRSFPRAVLGERELPAGPGNANALLLVARFEHVVELVTELGQVGISAEAVGRRAVDALRGYLAHGAPVGEHLSDQLLLPMLLGGGGQFVTGRPSSHLETNAAVITASGVGEVTIAPDEGDPQRRWRVDVAV